MAGDYIGHYNDNDVQIPGNVSTIVDLLYSKGIAWKEYLESIPSPGFTGSATTTESGNTAYARKHKCVADHKIRLWGGLGDANLSPLMSFDSITKAQSRSQNIVSFDQLRSDLVLKRLLQWVRTSVAPVNCVSRCMLDALVP